MKYTKFLFFPLVLVLLGFGCAQEYGTKETSQPPTETPTESVTQTTVSVTTPSTNTEKVTSPVQKKLVKKPALIPNDLDVEPSGILDPEQETYSMADRLSWYETLGWPNDCEADYRLSTDQERGDLAFYKIANNQYLLRVTCYVAAYQEGLLFLNVTTANGTFSGKILDLKTYNPITKRLTDFDNEGTHQVLGFEKFYPETKTLTLYTKARGLGDCGSVHAYRLTASGLELIKLQDQDCEVIDEWRLNNPDDINTPPWPVIYEKK